MKTDYKGPNEIGWYYWPKRGTTYDFTVEGHAIQIYVTEKRKRVRIYVDGVEKK